MYHSERTLLSWKFIAVAFVVICAVLDIFPRHGPPYFRFTGSDPAQQVWNIGWPIALGIYAPGSGLHLSPFFFAVLCVQAAIGLIGLIIFVRNRNG
jgi:hypothetical protein